LLGTDGREDDVSDSRIEPHALGPAKELLERPRKKDDDVVGERECFSPQRPLLADQTAVANLISGKRRITPCDVG
jgi:hypothetical protein